MQVQPDTQLQDPVSLEALLPALGAEFDAANDEGKEAIQKQTADYVRIAKFCAEIGIPFCVEYNPAYRAPHAVLHEIGHWAVKPDSYINVYRALSRRDFKITSATIQVTGPYSDEDEYIDGVMYYPGQNDRMPDWDLLDGMDPTPNEKAVRSWTRYAIDTIGIADPITDGRQRTYETRGIGDAVVAKGSSLRTWTPSAKYNPRAVQEFEAFGLDPENGIFRPLDESLVLPFENPDSLSQLVANVRCMISQHPERSYDHRDQFKEWLDHIKWKFDDVLVNDLQD